jgi:hypothetical protein
MLRKQGQQLAAKLTMTAWTSFYFTDTYWVHTYVSVLVGSIWFWSLSAVVPVP